MNPASLVTDQSAGAPGPTLPAAVLWDMDGTMVDTEPYWIASEIDLAAEHGGHWDAAKGHDLIGRSLLATAPVLRERGGIRLPDEEIVAELVSRVAGRIHADGAPWKPGARELLADLRELQVPCALVTMSYQQLAAAVLDVLPEGTFSAVVTGDTVTRGKPHPEPYLTGADRLGADIAECVAIEDSIPGVTSARAAGATVIGVQGIVELPTEGITVIDTLDGVSGADLLRLGRG